MRDLTRQHELALESPFEILRGLRVHVRFRPNDLERDGDSEFVVVCLIHDAHSAGAEYFDDSIAIPELLARHECRRCGRQGAAVSIRRQAVSRRLFDSERRCVVQRSESIAVENRARWDIGGSYAQRSAARKAAARPGRCVRAAFRAEHAYGKTPRNGAFRRAIIVPYAPQSQMAVAAVMQRSYGALQVSADRPLVLR